MKITYTPNPLRTIIELDDHEKEVFKLKLKIEQLEEDIFAAAYELDPKNANWTMSSSHRHPNGRTQEELIAGVLSDHLDTSYLYSEGEYKGRGLDARVDELFGYYVDDLRGSHAGDCTCVACSCTKCHAEGMLGIDTIKGLEKHAAHKIQAAFDYREGDEWKTRSLDEVLEILRTYEPGKPSPESEAAWAKAGGWEQHVPRWTKEAKAAYEWLLNYRNEHFPKETT